MYILRNPIIKSVLLLILYVILAFYTVNSTIIICKSIYSNHSYFQEYKSMSEKKEKMDNEINILKIKVAGLTEATINKDILEEATKNTLGMIKSGETVVIVE